MWLTKEKALLRDVERYKDVCGMKYPPTSTLCLSPISWVKIRRHNLVVKAKNNRRTHTIIKLGCLAGLFASSVLGISSLGAISTFGYGVSVLVSYARTKVLSPFPFLSLNALSKLEFSSSTLLDFLPKPQQEELKFLNSEIIEDIIALIIKSPVDERFQTYKLLLNEFTKSNLRGNNNVDQALSFPKQVLRVIEDCDHDSGMTFGAVRKSRKWGVLVSTTNPKVPELKAALEELLERKLIDCRNERYFIRRPIIRLKRWLNKKLKR